jgi:hypothetical protein
MPRDRSTRAGQDDGGEGCAARHSDVQGLSANDMYEMDQQGVEQLDYSKMPNART